MEKTVYLHYKDHEQNLATIFTYCKYHSLPDTIYIVHNDASIPRKHLTDYLHICNVKILTYQQLESKLNSQSNVDITGKIFDQSVVSHTEIAIVVYVYYTEYMSEILSHIESLSEHNNVDLYIYLCTENSVKEAKKLFYKCDSIPNVNLIFNWTVNSGRDIRSFLKFIQSGHHKKYKYICKIHTKKTTYLDTEWRSNYLYGLLEYIQAKKHWKALDKDPTKCTSVSKYTINEKMNSSNNNHKCIKKLAQILKLKHKNQQVYTFYAGTMFWVTSLYCDNLQKHITKNIIEDFETEPIGNDGTMAHAWERIFSLI